MPDYRPIHVLLYGRSGHGKSTFARTFPKPILVLNFEPRTKEEPYLELADLSGGRVVADVDNAPQVLDKDGKLLVQIEHYHDDPDLMAAGHTAHDRFTHRTRQLPKEFDCWKTVVIDSVTFMEIALRKHYQMVANRSAKDGRQWYAQSTFDLEDILMWRVSRWSCNVVVIAHTDSDRSALDGGVLEYKPRTPGKLGEILADAYGEFYRACTIEDKNGNTQYVLQTANVTHANGTAYPAATRIHAPQPYVAPYYDALWEAKRGVQPRVVQPASAASGGAAQADTPDRD